MAPCRAMGRAELQPAEKKLIGFSFGIGLFLLAALLVVNHVFPLAANRVSYRSGNRVAIRTNTARRRINLIR